MDKNNLEVKLNILLEHLSIRCSYYIATYDVRCNFNRKSRFTDCDGRIRKCELTLEQYKKEEK